MFFDLNLPISKLTSTGNASRKAKELQGEQTVFYTPLEVGVIEKRLDLLIHCLSRNVVILRELIISK